MQYSKDIIHTYIIWNLLFSYFDFFFFQTGAGTLVIMVLCLFISRRPDWCLFLATFHPRPSIFCSSDGLVTKFWHFPSLEQQKKSN